MQDRVGPVLAAKVDELAADATLLALTGADPEDETKARVFYRMSVPTIEIIPGVYFHVASEVPMENFWTALVDFQAWGDTYTQVRQIGARIVTLLHRDMSQDVDGVACFITLDSSGDLGDPSEGTNARLYRFRIEPARL